MVPPGIRPVKEERVDVLEGLVGTQQSRLDLFEKCRRYRRESKASQAQAMGIWPYFIPIQSQAGPEVVIDGRPMLMFGSNNYLGLTQDERVKRAMVEAIDRYGSACTGSRVLNGTMDLHIELERRLAAFTRKEAAFVFTTGYQTNLGAISVLVGRDDVALTDRADHASIVDGCRLSFGRTVKYRHNDMADLERLLAQQDPSHGVLIVTDGVFSMEGDLANLSEIVKLKERYGARLLLDDAHGIGVMGANGRGTAEYFGVEDRVDVIMGTFSKSFASTGGFVAGDEDVIYYIKHNARPMIFSAAIPPTQAAAALAALDIIEREPERRVQLWENVHRLKRGVDELGFNTGNSMSPIVPIIIGDEYQLIFFWKRLFEQGLFTNAAVPPSVEPGRALIRMSCIATHKPEHVDRALSILEATGREFGLL